MKDLIKIVGFQAKENASAIYIKKYLDGYAIEIDFDKKTFHFGGKIKIGGKDSQNITKPEDWVVLECVNRLLETGYKPENISLEKVYPAGHGFSGRLDICVNREDGSEYLLIECKTYGKEFDKEFTRIKKDGGQLFTYFKFSNKANLIMLYASQLINNEIIYKNEIVKIEDDYRVGDVKDFYNSWNKNTKHQGVWENEPYDFKSKKFTKADLKELNEAESTKIFHEFASILRKHSVSDKPNAFNKIFNLFLAKLYDEAKRENDELEFHWREDDNAVDFQVRLINLHKDGLFAFLQKEIEGIDEKDFKANSPEELLEKKKKVLKFNNILAIKEVLDDASFDENQRVLKDVVKLLEKYQIRYPRKQQHLSDFFEKLLTTGLKQEVGQYFTPPPITKFIVRSIPIKQMIEKEVNKESPELPAIIDYAAGSGHFITEALEEYQDIINSFKEEEMKNFFPKAKSQVKSWQADPYEWAKHYVYGIEKDYRLVKVAKVGCYFYGDGVAQIIHGDGLDSFTTSKTYKGLLKENTNLEDSTKAKFSLVLSNPPYSVNDCKDDLEYIGAQNDFTLYPYLSDNSDDIECLFIERTKHLLKDDGVAAIVLPSSILNTKGIQSKTREIILYYFDIVAITELGKSTFMATPTETVILFLKRRNNNLIFDWIKSLDTFLDVLQDITINGIINPVSKYINYVWGEISFDDYVTLLRKSPNDIIKKHELYNEYRSKIKFKEEKDFFETLISLEKAKLLYFIITVKQKVVIVKTGKKEDEKRFLGYEFSARRGSEGMHPIQKGKSIDNCTKLYNSNDLEDYTKASTYIYKALEGNFNFDIENSIQKNVFKQDLVDMLNFDRTEFENAISTTIKKKVNVNSKWDIVRIGSFVDLQNGFAFKSSDYVQKSNTLNFRQANIRLEGILDLEHKKTYLPDDFRNKYKDYILKDGDVVIAMTDMNNELNLLAIPTIFKNGTDKVYLLNQRVGKFMKFDLAKINPIYLNSILKSITTREQLKQLGFGSIQYNLSKDDLLNFKIPLPPLDIQKKIVAEIEVLEAKEKKAIGEIEKGKETIINLFNQAESKADKKVRLSDENIFQVSIGKRVLKNEFVENGKIPVYSANVIEPFGNIDKLLIEDFSKPSVLWGIDGDWMVNHLPKDYPFYPTDHCGVLKVKDNSINEKYLAFILEKEGKAFEFSRTKRASIDRIQGIKIAVPPLSEQQKIVSEIEKIEAKITTLETEIASIPKQKEAILKKYL
ncbi:N-6 DNA methylase [Flavobacterium psychrophilum]|uniref:restriction endonuclease subunit S n=1 Tax=Flavobacterium psychrophilum TaxID=96345 RepID=UPI000B7C4D53|nr:restriction endonuclease subunit S [Flavobacterium psychrophilum]SNB08809.1 N-6 DNA methylase [Flavobacterium psychrophilum]